MSMSQSDGGSSFPQVVKRRLAILSLAISLMIMPLAAKPAQAQTECLDGCQTALTACMNTARDPVQEAICQDNYWKCVEGCYGSYAAVLG